MDGKGSLRPPGDPTAFQTREVRWTPRQSKSGGMEGINGTSHNLYARTLCRSPLCSACGHTSEELMALSLSFISQLPGGHKKAKRFLCEIILATSSLTILDLWFSREPLLGCHWHQIASCKGHAAARADKESCGNSHVANSFSDEGSLVRMM